MANPLSSYLDQWMENSVEIHPIDRAPQTIQKLLHPGEQLFWWERPSFKYMRFPVKFIDLFAGGSLAALAALCFCLKSFLAGYHVSPNYVIFYFIVFTIFAVIIYLRLLARTYTAALRKEPPYWKYTFYAITDQRAMMIVRIPGGALKVFEYLPTEIDPPTTLVRPDGSGIVTFGAPREHKVGRYGPSITFPGGFLGISRVQTVADLLQALRSGDEQAMQCSPGQTLA